MAGEKPFFRADHVGSLLRPHKLLQARNAWENGALPGERLEEIEDEAILEAVRYQECLGLQSISDGEFRRDIWWGGFIPYVGGIEVTRDKAASPFTIPSDEVTAYVPKTISTVRRITRDAPIMERDYLFVRNATNQTPKVTIPSPSRFHY